MARSRAARTRSVCHGFDCVVWLLCSLWGIRYEWHFPSALAEAIGVVRSGAPPTNLKMEGTGIISECSLIILHILSLEVVNRLS